MAIGVRMNEQKTQEGRREGKGGNAGVWAGRGWEQQERLGPGAVHLNIHSTSLMCLYPLSHLIFVHIID